MTDLAVGVDGAFFGFTEVKLGLIPAVISPFVMERIGRTNAQRYFLTGERFQTDVAVKIGLPFFFPLCFMHSLFFVTLTLVVAGLLHERVETVDALDERVEQLAKDICDNSPQAVRLCKQLIQNVNGRNYFDPETRSFLANEIASIRVSEEGQEGLSAFLGKRTPSWRQ